MTRNTNACTFVATVMACATALALAPARAHENPGAGPLKVDPLVGYWVGRVTVVDCTSGTPLSGFDTGQLINHGGTMNAIDYTSPPTSAGPSVGYWYRQKGGSYFMRFRFAQYHPDGNVMGFRVVTKTVKLESLHEQSSLIRSTALDPAGNVLGTRCATETASRFE